MTGDGRKLRARRAAWGASIVPLMCWASIVFGGTGVGRTTKPTAVEPSPVDVTTGSSATLGQCQEDVDCDDNDPCTRDACIDADCIRTPIPDCAACTPTLVRPSIDVAFLMDTSGSMGDEAAVLCGQISEIIAALEAKGVTINPRVLGLSEMPGGSFSCLTGDVASLVCGTAACDTPTCPYPGDPSSHESWGPATAVAASGLNWTPGAVRILVPIGDEGPCNGSRPNGCNDPGDDADSIQAAIAAAVANNVTVSPIVGTGADGCVRGLAAQLAAGTGGTAFFTQDAGTQLADAVVDLILSRLAPDNSCDDGNFCTRDDTCTDGFCVGTPIVGCEPCTPAGFCSDGNACTTDTCVNGDCITTPNFDEESFCCEPALRSLTPLSDGEPCTADVCDVETGNVTHPPLKDGISCDDGAFCSVGEMCMTGVCGGGDARDCSLLNDACNRGMCNESSDACEAEPANENGICDDGDACVVGETCSAGVCGGGADVACPDNQDPCTDLICDPAGAEGNCSRRVPVNDGGACDDGQSCLVGETCDSGSCSGGLPVVCPDNGDPCTDVACDLLGSEGNCDVVVSTDPGADCDDGDACTTVDVCDGFGGCAGTDINTLPCSTDADCFGAVCDSATDQCFCSLTPRLELDPVPGGLEDGCYPANRTITINVVLGSGATTITSGQFSIAYNPTILRFLAVAPGSTVDPGSPFGQPLFMEVDQSIGSICYGVGVADGASGSRGPAVMASLSFRTRAACTNEEVFFLPNASCETKLIDDAGQPVGFIPIDTGIITIAGDAPSITCPSSTTVNSDAGTVTANVGWPAIVATGGCGGAAQLTCTATHSAGLNIDALITSGGRFAAGLAEFHCEATDVCGQTSSCDWTVQVDRTNCVRARVQLSPLIATGPIARCIEFEFFTDCVEPPTIMRQEFTFGGVFNLPGRGGPQEFVVPAGSFACVTARDPLHSLRAPATPRIENGCYILDFEGDPFFGGNWLIGGNLNGDGAIDILDFGVLVSEGFRGVSPHSSCDATGPHADINGDGLVDALDFTFVTLNFLQQDKTVCCSGSAASARTAPITSISLRDLEALGLGRLRAADLNGDGVLDTADIAAYYEGAQPAPRRKAARAPRR